MCKQAGQGIRSAIHHMRLFLPFIYINKLEYGILRRSLHGGLNVSKFDM